MINKKQKNGIIFLFLLLPLIHLFVFSYIPIIFNVILSFTNWDGLGELNFIGLGNYKRIFTDDRYLLLFKNTLWYLLAAVPQLLFGATLAIFVVGRFRGLNIFKGILIFPYLLNGIIVSTVFIIFFNPQGTLNLFLGALGLEGLQKNWLQDLKLVNPAIASTSIWRYYGLSFLMFFGALQAVPPNLYEAASIDGCSKIQEIKHISVPFIKKVLFINIILSIAGSIQVFEPPYIMLGGSNGTATPVIQINQSMGSNRFGFAAAFSVVVFFVVIISVGLQKLLTKGDDA